MVKKILLSRKKLHIPAP